MPIVRRRLLKLGAAALAALGMPCRANAQAYPNRPVRVIVTTGPGGQGDTIARLLAQKLSEALGQTFYVENIGGAGGNIAHGTAARSAPDGYTILAAGGSFVTNPSLYAKNSVRPGQGFRAGFPGLLVAACAGGASFGTGAQRRRARSARAGKSGQVRLRVGRCRHAGASRRRTVQARARCRPHARAVQRRRAGHRRHGRGTCSDCDLGAADRADVREGRVGSRARGHERQTVAGAARCADHGRGRNAARSRHPDRSAGALRYAARDRRASPSSDRHGDDANRLSGSACWSSASSRWPTRPSSSPNGSRRKRQSGARSSVTPTSRYNSRSRSPHAEEHREACVSKHGRRFGHAAILRDAALARLLRMSRRTSKLRLKRLLQPPPWRRRRDRPAGFRPATAAAQWCRGRASSGCASCRRAVR